VVSPDAIDKQIDDLYRGPLSEFTAARNALVKTLRGADASRVRKLAKPTVVAWAVNQVYWNARALFERLMKTGDQLRKTQIAALHGKSGDLRGASDAHRRAIGDAVQEAERLAKQSGSQPGADALMRTFEALSLAPEPAEPYGRLTQPLQPAGFEALTGVTPALRLARTDRDGDQDETRGRSGPDNAAHDDSPESERGAKARGREEPSHRGVRLQPDRSAKQRKLEAAAEAKQRAQEAQARAAAAKKHQAEIKKAQAAVAHAKAAEDAAREKFEHAQQERRAAEQRLAFLTAHPAAG
jgi:hypothetical protein